MKQKEREGKVVSFYISRSAHPGAQVARRTRIASDMLCPSILLTPLLYQTNIRHDQNYKR
jgi:hypothetical protein